MLSGPGSVAAPRPAAVVGTDGDTLEGSAAANEDVEVLQYKVAVVGNGAVGKTTLISRLCTPDFTPQYKQTLGVDLYKKRIDLPDGVKASLQIWDIGGQTLNAPMLSHYLYAAQVRLQRALSLSPLCHCAALR
jgi:GTPase SAR1 family protein